MRKTAIFALLFMLTAALCSAQQKMIDISGTVHDENGNPLPGAVVVIDGTRTGSTTDADGHYKITAPRNSVLSFTYIGYKEEKVPVGSETEITIALTPDTTFLDEVVVVGYGTMKRSDLTGAVSSVSSKAIANFKTASVSDALAGQIAGVNITSADGTPGGGYDIKIRGLGTVNGDASPLFIVDGFEVANIDYLANQDIASIEVLKDASAAAIYGSRAANGVVLVTTKSGHEGRTEVSYNGSATYRTLSKHLDVLNPYDYVKLQVEVNPSRYGERYYRTGNDSSGNPYLYQSLEDYTGVPGIDWQDEAFRPTWSQNHDVSVLGGNRDTQYAMSFSHFDEEGMFEGSGFAKNNARLKFSQKLNKYLKLDASINYTLTNRTGIGTGGSTLSNILGYRPTGGLFTSDYQLRFNSYDPILEQTGLANTNYFNPILNASKIDTNTRREQWIGTAALTVIIKKGLTFKTSGAYNVFNQRYNIFYRDGSAQADRGDGPYGTATDARQMRWSFNNVLTWYPKLPKGHSSNIVVGQEMTYAKTENFSGTSTEFPMDDLGVNNLGLGATPTSVTTSVTDRGRLSFFTRGTYNYKNRYLLTATLRADASTVFSAKHKWGFFPSFALAWNMANEEWMKSFDKISNAKLRIGYGTVGNDNISSYLSLNLLNDAKYGYGSKQVTVLYPSQLPNEDLKWEGQTTTNLGLDLGFFNSRLNVTLDLFNKDSKDLLLAQSLALNTGFSSQWQNIGKIRNRGIELTVNSINVSKRFFSWTSDFNISFIRNTLVSLLEGDDHLYSRSGFNSNFASYDYIAQVGAAVGNMYGYVFDGIYQYSDFNVTPDGQMVLKPGIPDISDHAGTNVRPGFVKYKDVSGPDGKPDGKITDEDRTIIGNGQPDWYGGLTNTFYLYGVDLSFLLQFTVGNDVYNAQRMYSTQTKLEMMNSLGEVRDRWTAQNASNKVPSTDGYVSYDVYSRFIEDGSFLRLKNITMGYTIPEKFTRKYGVAKLRFYATAQNLWCLTRYSGFDPEVNMLNSNLMPSFDYGAYPRSRAFTGGVEVRF